MARLFIRIGFGLALAFVGFAHYQDPLFAEAAGRGLGVLEPVGMIWGYVLPGLMIAGGLLLAFGIYMNIAAYLCSIALASIPAGLMLKSAMGISLEDTMPPAVNALIWILVLMFAVKGNHCGPNACCNCPTDMPATPVAPVRPVTPVVKSAPVAPVATVKTPAPAKKAPVKKAPMKKPSKSSL